METRKGLYRSSKDTVIRGVAGGIAEYLNTDPILIRIIFVLLALFGGGGLIIYLILWIALPVDYSFTFNNKNFSDMEKEKTNAKPEKDQFNQETHWHGKNNGSLVAGLILITIGVIFLISRFFPRIDFADLWPIILLVAGIALIRMSYIKPKKQ